MRHVRVSWGTDWCSWERISRDRRAGKGRDPDPWTRASCTATLEAWSMTCAPISLPAYTTNVHSYRLQNVCMILFVPPTTKIDHHLAPCAYHHHNYS